MLYHILVPLIGRFSALNIFKYITFRAGYAMTTALIIGFVVGPRIIRFLRRWHVEEIIRNDGPQTHLTKRGTPTMGGLIVLTGIVIPTLLWARLDNLYVWLALFSTLWMGAVGFLDDYLKIKMKMSKGLVAKYKLTGQIALGCIVGTILFLYDADGPQSTVTLIPFLKR